MTKKPEDNVLDMEAKRKDDEGKQMEAAIYDLESQLQEFVGIQKKENPKITDIMCLTRFLISRMACMEMNMAGLVRFVNVKEKSRQEPKEESLADKLKL